MALWCRAPLWMKFTVHREPVDPKELLWNGSHTGEAECNSIPVHCPEAGRRTRSIHSKQIQTIEKEEISLCLMMRSKILPCIPSEIQGF